jgi:hypothetical protein
MMAFQSSIYQCKLCGRALGARHYCRGPCGPTRLHVPKMHDDFSIAVAAKLHRLLFPLDGFRSPAVD